MINAWIEEEEGDLLWEHGAVSGLVETKRRDAERRDHSIEPTNRSVILSGFGLDVLRYF